MNYIYVFIHQVMVASKKKKIYTNISCLFVFLLFLWLPDFLVNKDIQINNEQIGKQK